MNWIKYQLIAWALIAIVGCSVGCSTGIDYAGLIDDMIEDDTDYEQNKVDFPNEEDPAPVVVPDEPEDMKPQVNKGGTGLYKPESNLWMLNGVRAPSILWAAEVPNYDIPHGRAVKYFRLGNGSAHRADGKQPAVDSEDYYHGQGLKLRDAKAAKSGNTFVAYSRDGKLIARKLIIDRDTRQEHGD